ncbi:MAG: serine/threonine-protein kinase [Candidatus Eisenbacteria bacterium]|uniref:Serine/threonine protein kinase n=1 Tax=Eiseniibacteriota bacterium TaxID=2212470 RepID=A0A956LY20_UNCEI|nr:serine/threonine protein kinase [Candidatus Eisenbacteria bacterium]
MGLAFPAMRTTSDPREVEHLRNRVRLYLQVMLTIDVVAYVTDYVTPLFIDGLTMPEYPLITRVIRYTCTGIVAAAWVVLKFLRPGRAISIAIECAVTISLTLAYIHIAGIHMGANDTGANDAPFAPVFAMFGIMMLLSVRAALVPSPVLRTVVIGSVAMACLFTIGKASIAALDPRVFDGIMFTGGAFILITSVTSRVIYGLRRQVRQALQLGQYTLEQKLGEGGMGAVYRARHAMLRREAAIKLIKPELIGDGGGRARALQRFEREAHVTANLRSPHTIELYDFGVSDDGAFYYVMELLEGIDLESAVGKYGAMPPGRVVFLLRQVCDSLAEAHAAGLVHRDIKPANIFACRYGLQYDFIKVLDFGLVGLGHEEAGDDPKLTAEGMVGGTPAYLAPEAATRSDSVDGRADLYALGCVAYWLLTAHILFERETAMATVLAHVNDDPVPPSLLCETPIPSRLEQLVLACLAKKPADRPASAAELSRLLEAVGIDESWDQGDAERWWNAHRPERDWSFPSTDPGTSVTVTRAWS